MNYSRRAIGIVLVLLLYSTTVYAIDTVPGFPKPIGEMPGGGGQVFYDLDRDGVDEAIVTGNGKVFAWHIDGTPYLNPDGTFFSLNSNFRIFAPPAVGDITGDGIAEVVIAADRLYIVDSQGNLITDLDIGGKSYAAPVIADIDEDGNPEIIGSGRNPGSNHVYVYNIQRNGKAEPRRGFPVGDVQNSSPAIGKLASDGAQLVFGERNPSISAVSNDGTMLKGFPVNTGGQFGSNASPAIGDIDADGRLEVVIGTDGFLMVIGSDGRFKQGWPQKTGNLAMSSPALADRNGSIDSIFVGSYEGDFYGFDPKGNQLSGFPKRIGSRMDSPIIADIDNDSVLEVVVGSKDGKLYAWKVTGQAVQGFPFDLGSPIQSAPIIGTDGSGHTLLGISVDNEFHLYDLGPNTWNPDMQPWSMVKHDPQRTGNYHYTPGAELPDTIDKADFSIQLSDISNLPRTKSDMTKAEDLKITAVVREENTSVGGVVTVECFAVDQQNRKTDIGTEPVLLTTGAVENIEFHTDKLQRVFEGSITVRIKEKDGNTQNNQAHQDVNIYYTPFKFGKDNYSFANDGLDFYDSKAVWRSYLASFTGLSAKWSNFVLPFYYFLWGNASTFIEQDGYCYGFAATSILYRDHAELRVHAREDITFEYKSDDPDVQYRIQEYFKTQIPYITEYAAGWLRGEFDTFDTNEQYDKAVDFLKNQNRLFILELPKHAVTAYKIIQMGDQAKLYYYENEDKHAAAPHWGRFTKEGKYGKFYLVEEIEGTVIKTKYNPVDYMHVRYPDMTLPDKLKVTIDEVAEYVLSKLRKDGQTLVVAASPVRTLITDENGRRIGIAHGSKVSEIPGAEMNEFGDVEIFLVPSQGDYEIESIGIDNGVFDLYCVVKKADDTFESMAFREVSVSRDSVAVVEIGEDIEEYEMQIDANGDGAFEQIITGDRGKTVPWDLNSDGIIDISDLIIVAGAFGTSGEGIVGDINTDGIVDITDLMIVASHFGEGTGLSAPAKPQIADIGHIDMVENWLREARTADDGSELFQRGISVLEHLLNQIIPSDTALLPNFPNPFNPDTWIPYQLSEEEDVSIVIYDLAGRIVKHLDIGHKPAGVYRAQDRAAHWDGRNEVGESVVSGVYFVLLEAGEYKKTRRIVLIR